MYPIPEDFGAVGDGSNDDTHALKKWANHAIQNRLNISLKPGSKYYITDTIWFGKANCGTGFHGIDGNDAAILPAINNKPVFDFVGVQNGVFAQIKDIAFDSVDGYLPTCAILQGRPKQKVGEKSSGNFLFSRVKMYGNYSCSAYYNVQSESNYFEKCGFFNYSGLAAAWHKTDYFRDTFTISYRNLDGDFLPGQLLTGLESGATATVIRSSDSQLFCKTNTDNISSKVFGNGVYFSHLEEIRTKTGKAACESKNYYVAGPASPNVELEEDSTSTFQVIDAACFFNNVSRDSLFPCVSISNWNDVVIKTANLNHYLDSATLLEVIGDGFVRPPQSGGAGCNGIKVLESYLHSMHSTSLQLGCPLTESSQTFSNFEFKNLLVAGSEQERLSVLGSKVLVQDCTVEVNGKVNIGNARCEGANLFRILARNSKQAAFICNNHIEGDLHCLSNADVKINCHDNHNQLNVHYADTGLTSYRAPKIEVIEDGAINASSKMIRVFSADGTPQNINYIHLKNGAPVHGEIVSLRAGRSSEDISIVPRKSRLGNIISSGGTLRLSSNEYSSYQYDASSQRWYKVK